LGNDFVKRAVIDNKTQKTLQNHSKLTADTLLIGYRYKRIVPAMFLSNIKLEKLIYYNDNLQGKSKQNTILTGLNFAYFITKNISSSIFYIMPNKKIYLRDSFGLGINYIF
jgi:outer membrane protein W